jgi:site-specific recombinase XerC
VAVSPSDIEHAVINLLRYHEAETAMLFCATRDNVRHLHASLVERGFAAVALSGEHSQSERNHALQALRDGRAGLRPPTLPRAASTWRRFRWWCMWKFRAMPKPCSTVRAARAAQGARARRCWWCPIRAAAGWK